eukprot:TRINITY_DN7286_c0_g1_i1.p1 TRINITY_DN7286_c0_g1~~TRINITY_DN7286_c0_g1_i1.p1  ORF type:complete len:134 (-),score=36.07 TRINITY_DN7286_c0_g1_i1:97-498(-)
MARRSRLGCLVLLVAAATALCVVFGRCGSGERQATFTGALASSPLRSRLRLRAAASEEAGLVKAAEAKLAKKEEEKSEIVEYEADEDEAEKKEKKPKEPPNPILTAWQAFSYFLVLFGTPALAVQYLAPYHWF